MLTNTSMSAKSARPSGATGVHNLVHSDGIVTPLESGLTSQRANPRRYFPSGDQTSSSSTRTASDPVQSSPKTSGKTFELDEIRTAIHPTSVYLSDQMREAGIMSMVKSMVHWEQLVDEFSESTQSQLSGMITEQVQKAFFSHRRNGSVQRKSSHITYA